MSRVRVFCRDCGRELEHRNARGGFDPATGVQETWQELRCRSISGRMGWHEDCWRWEGGVWVDRTFESLTYGQPFATPVSDDTEGAG